MQEVGKCMRFVSWNVNGLRACLRKNFKHVFENFDADFFCVQETKMQPNQATINAPEYCQYFNSAQKRGYSGTAVFTKHKVVNAFYDIQKAEHSTEGRTITIEMPEFYLVNVYTPNSQNELKRLSYRMLWEDDFRDYLLKLKNIKPVIVCGDMNVAHQEIDLKNPSTNHYNAGFSDEERSKFSKLLSSGFVDTFRYLNPDKVKYSWWSYRANARKNNSGWRIDYFLISDNIKDKIISANIHNDIQGSDHCPVSLDIKL